MKNGKTLTLYMTLPGFLMVLWRNLFKKQKALEDSKILFALRRKGEHWDWEYLDGTRTYKTREFLSRVYFRSLKLGKYFHKLKLKVKEPPGILLKFMANLYGVSALVCVILTCVLLLPLLVIVSLVGMFRQE